MTTIQWVICSYGMIFGGDGNPTGALGMTYDWIKGFVGNPGVCWMFKGFFLQAEDGIRDGTVTGVQTCALPISFVTQNGDAVNLTTEAGEAYRAWPDWNAPYSRIWIEARGEGAVYSPDGMRIQFDDGRVWQRDIGPPPGVTVGRAPAAY